MPRRLLLIGAGPAHAEVLAAFAREPLVGAELALLTPDPHFVQPGLLPGFVAGQLRAEQLRIDTATLAQAASATWLQGRVVRFDAAAPRVVLADGSEVEADLVSIDETGASDRDRLEGGREHALALHPSALFVSLFEGLVDLAARRPIDVVVIGAGAEAVELALALNERLAHALDERARIVLVAGDDGVLPGWPAAAIDRARDGLRQARINVFKESCKSLTGTAAVLAGGTRLACDAALLATPPSPPAWFADSGLALADDGWVSIGPSLQSPSQPRVLAPPRAVAQAGAALAAQLRQAVAAGPMAPVKLRPPARRWLRLQRQRALVAWGSWVLAGRLVGVCSAWRDRRAGPAAPLTRSA